jgi:hypothetical protein
MRSNRTLSMKKFSGVPNVTRRKIQPHGITTIGPTPKNGPDSWSLDIGICSFFKVAKLIRFNAAPPLIRTWYNLVLMMVKETSSGSCPAPTTLLGQLEALKLNHLWCGVAFGVGASVVTSRHRFLTMRWGGGGHVLRTSEHDVEHLAALIVTGLRVRMAIYGLEIPFGLLEP